MKRIFSFYALVFFLFFFSCASSSVPNKEGSSVWKISRNGNTLFLAGSIHVLRDSDFPLPKEFDLAFSQSAALVLEADIKQLENEDFMQYMVSQMFLRNGQTLQTLLEPDVYEMLIERLSKYKLPLENISLIKPSMIVNMLTMFQIQELGFSQQGVDSFYMEKANSENIPVLFLESVETQIEMLVSMGEGYENDFVLYSLQDMENTEMYLSTIVNDWKTGESANTVISIEEIKEETPLLYKPLITDRNDAWLPQIEEYLNSGNCYFIIVGLMHIYGPDGLLPQLKDLGCTIEQLIFK